MKKILLLSLVILFSCNSKNQFDKNDPVDLNGLEIDQDIVVNIAKLTRKKAQKNTVIRYRPADSTRRVYEPIDSLVKGVRFKKVKEELAYKIIDKYFDKVKNSGNYLFLSNIAFDDAYNTYHDVIIAPASNQIDLIKFVGTDAVNYDLMNDDIINWFSKRQAEFEFNIIVADFDAIEANIVSEPKSYKALAKEIYKFCPDVIEQGHDDMAQLVKHLKDYKHMWFWWD